MAVFITCGDEVITGFIARAMRRTMPRQPLMLAPGDQLPALFLRQFPPDICRMAHLLFGVHASACLLTREHLEGWTPNIRADFCVQVSRRHNSMSSGCTERHSSWSSQTAVG